MVNRQGAQGWHRNRGKLNWANQLQRVELRCAAAKGVGKTAFEITLRLTKTLAAAMLRGLRCKIDEMKCHEAARRECPEMAETGVGRQQPQVAVVGGSRRSAKT